MKHGFLAPALALVLLTGAPFVQAQEHHDDPRVGLSAGWIDAGEAAMGMELLTNVPRPEGFYNPDNVGDMSKANSDMAFSGNHVIVGNYTGFNIYDVTEASNPVLRTSVVCPGGQGDVSVFGDLLFISVEEARGRLDCGVGGTTTRVDPERFRGIRVFDISDLDAPQQVAAVQTCRGSHTNTVVTDPNDPDHVYVYNSGSSYVRPGEELPGCAADAPEENPETALFRIEVIKVPLAAPEEARVINMPRVFADAETGRIDGLWSGGDHGPGTQRTAVTNHCHDITAFPELGIAAGACSGNGILLDISDPANPVRIAEVSDPNFAYWHSATFSNDGSKVIFTDEWGGGMGARCKADDPREWGANAIFNVVDNEFEFAGYYKLPAPQTATENCVAHNGSLIPVPGRDIKVQAWYQGGITAFDFTDPENPVEIAFFDRGPINEEVLVMGGHWSAYWYNGYIFGSEIARGLDVLRLTPTEHLSQNEIDAALLVQFDEFNPQEQPLNTWQAHPVVAHAYLDQLERTEALPADRIAFLRSELNREDAHHGLAEASAEVRQHGATAEEHGRAIDAARLSALADTLEGLAHAH